MHTTIAQIDGLIQKIDAFSKKSISPDSLEHYILDWSELSYEWEEAAAWAYIRYSCETANEDSIKVYEHLIQSGEKTEPIFFNIKKKVYDLNPDKNLNPETYSLFIKLMKTDIELYREKNIPLWIEEANLSKDYQGIIGSLTISHDGQELTLQQASRYLEENNREVRRQVWEKIYEQIFKSSEKINKIYTKQIELRDSIARNAGFENFRDYAHVSKNRFDYTPEDCFEFHQAIEKKIMPVYNALLKQRKNDLQADTLKPYDLQVDSLGRKPLKPFNEEKELTDKTISILKSLNPEIGNVLLDMKNKGFLDLDSRKNKAPGGYNYPLSKSGLSFIFMNSAGLQRDVITLLHESGHAYQSFLTDSEQLFLYRQPCMEVAELASMSMELITMDHWDTFYPDKEEAKRAKMDHLEDIIGFFPWMAAVDSFQHWVYTNPKHSEQDRLACWEKTLKRFGGEVDWKHYEHFRKTNWMRQGHIFTSPFYYVEYGIAQLGALQIWKSYLESPEKTLKNYKKALSLGSRKSMKEVYDEAGIVFGFSEKLIARMMKFAEEQIHRISKN